MTLCNFLLNTKWRVLIHIFLAGLLLQGQIHMLCNCNLSLAHSYLFIATATTGGGALFCKENAKFWPILAPFRPILAILLRIYSLAGVLGAVCWCTKIDRYQVCISINSIMIVITNISIAVDWSVGYWSGVRRHSDQRPLVFWSDRWSLLQKYQVFLKKISNDILTNKKQIAKGQNTKPTQC